MQHRMKEFTLQNAEIETLLQTAPVGHISTVNSDGYPYTVAVHFIYRNGKLYFHGLPKGQKLDNIRRCAKVCFTVDQMEGLLLENLPSPCKADTAYHSAVVLGNAAILTDIGEKQAILQALVEKYAPAHCDQPMPEAAVAATAVVEIIPTEITGKYHR